KEAREKCQEARKLHQSGKDPAAERQNKKMLARFEAANTFGAIAEEWKNANEDKWCADHAARTWKRVENHLLPALGNRPIADISALEVLTVLQKLEAEKKTETTHRLLQICRGIFQRAVLTKRVAYNPVFDLKGALKAHRGKNYPSIGANQLSGFFE